MKPINLLIVGYMPHYRITLFNELSKKYDLTVLYVEDADDIVPEIEYKVKPWSVVRIKKFLIHQRGFFDYCKKFDVVIASGDIHWLSCCCLSLIKRRFKLIYWSIGVSADRNKPGFDTRDKWTWVKDFFSKKADALLYYSEYPIIKNKQRGYDENKMFVANNTIDVLPVNRYNRNKTSLLFIGTLYKTKGIITLLEAYKEVNLEKYNLPDIEIIGGGPEFEFLNGWIIKNNLRKKIHLRGAVFDKREKLKYFDKSLACISPKQAGLSVLECMGYGVPFITEYDSITGGERFNIVHGVNGMYITEDNTLKDILIDISTFPDKYIDMGYQAYNYYINNRTINHMVNDIENCVNFVLKKENCDFK